MAETTDTRWELCLDGHAIDDYDAFNAARAELASMLDDGFDRERLDIRPVSVLLDPATAT